MIKICPERVEALPPQQQQHDHSEKEQQQTTTPANDRHAVSHLDDGVLYFDIVAIRIMMIRNMIQTQDPTPTKTHV